MAMRWSFYDRYERRHPMMRQRLATHAHVVAVALALACVSTVTRYYLPDAKNPRFELDAATQTLDQFLRVQCPERLAANKSESGDVRVTILTDTTGAVTRAELVSSSGDALLDGLFGTVAAQLKVDSLKASTRASATRRLRMGYSCAPNAAASTLEVLR
jgi:TonB family protein